MDSVAKERISDPECAVPSQMTLSKSVRQDDFLLHLGLLTPDSFMTVEEHRKTLKETKRDVRNKTYIPEFTEVSQSNLISRSNYRK